MWPRVRIPARSPNKNPRNFAGVFIWCSQCARFEPAGFGERSERRTGATRRAVGLTDAPTGAQSRLANHSLIFRNFAGVFIWCSQRARFEPAGFGERSERRTGATRRAVGLTDAPTGAQSRLANHSLIFRNFAGVFIWCSQRAQGSERMMRASKSTGVCSDNSTERRCLKCWSAFRGRKTTLFSSFPPAWHECSQKVGG